MFIQNPTGPAAFIKSIGQSFFRPCACFLSRRITTHINKSSATPQRRLKSFWELEPTAVCTSRTRAHLDQGLEVHCVQFVTYVTDTVVFISTCPEVSSRIAGTRTRPSTQVDRLFLCEGGVMYCTRAYVRKLHEPGLMLRERWQGRDAVEVRLFIPCLLPVGLMM